MRHDMGIRCKPSNTLRCALFWRYFLRKTKSRALRYNLFARALQKGFSLQSLTHFLPWFVISPKPLEPSLKVWAVKL